MEIGLSDDSSGEKLWEVSDVDLATEQVIWDRLSKDNHRVRDDFGPEFEVLQMKVL